MILKLLNEARNLPIHAALYFEEVNGNSTIIYKLDHDTVYWENYALNGEYDISQLTVQGHVEHYEMIDDLRLLSSTKTCDCELTSLLSQGCTCGSIERYRQ